MTDSLAASSSPQLSREFVRNPDLRSICTFFLGWTFFLAIQYLAAALLRSRVAARAARLRSPIRITGPWSSKPQPDVDIEQKSAGHSTHSISSSDPRDQKNLVAVLTLAMAAAVLGDFVSLLSFRAGNGDVACAFVTAWSGLTGQAMRAAGFSKLYLELSALGIGRPESYAIWASIFVSVALSFVQQAIGVGTISAVPELPGPLLLCYRTHPLVAAVVASAVNICIELYFVARIYSVVVPEFLRSKHRRAATLDARIGRAFSLLILDLMTIIPTMLQISIPADIIPFSIGAILVLISFNYQTPPAPPAITVSLTPSNGSIAIIGPSDMMVSQPESRNGSTRSSVIQFASPTSEKGGRIGPLDKLPLPPQSKEDEAASFPEKSPVVLPRPRPFLSLRTPTQNSPTPGERGVPSSWGSYNSSPRSVPMVRDSGLRPPPRRPAALSLFVPGRENQNRPGQRPPLPYDGGPVDGLPALGGGLPLAYSASPPPSGTRSASFVERPRGPRPPPSTARPFAMSLDRSSEEDEEDEAQEATRRISIDNFFRQAPIPNPPLPVPTVTTSPPSDNGRSSLPLEEAVSPGTERVNNVMRIITGGGAGRREALRRITARRYLTPHHNRDSHNGGSSTTDSPTSPATMATFGPRGNRVSTQSQSQSYSNTPRTSATFAFDRPHPFSAAALGTSAMGLPSGPASGRARSSTLNGSPPARSPPASVARPSSSDPVLSQRGPEQEESSRERERHFSGVTASSGSTFEIVTRPPPTADPGSSSWRGIQGGDNPA